MKEMKRREFENGAATVVVASTCLCGLNGCATFTKVGNTVAIRPEALTRRMMNISSIFQRAGSESGRRRG